MRSWLVLFIVAALSLAAAAHLASAIQTSSPTPPQFNITQDFLRLNWTAVDTANGYEANITINPNASNQDVNVSFIAAVQNGTTSTTAQAHTVIINYTQPFDSWSNDVKSSYTNSDCGSSTAGATPLLPLRVKNATVIFTSNSSNITTGGNANLTLVFATGRGCMPGRYFGYLNITNATNVTHFVNLNVTLDVPIDTQNSLSTNGTKGGVGQFRGTLDSNETEDHRYFFNTSALANVTSIVVNVSASGQDADIFLFDQNTGFLARGAEHGSADKLVFMYPQSNQMFQIRVYGNRTTSGGIAYTGFLVLGTLEANNTTSNTRLDKAAFGSLGIAAQRNVTATMTNTGPINHTSVAESKEVYFVRQFRDGAPTGARNFTLQVPDFATVLDARLNWTGGTNYTLRLFKPDGTLVAASANKSAIANKTGVGPEEVVGFTPSSSTVGFSDDGSWTLEVINNTVSPDPYNVTAKIFVTASDWISSNYSTRTFNQTGSGFTGTSATHLFNITVPNSTLGGTLEGRMRYTSAAGAITDIPFNTSISTGELLVNGTFNKSTILLGENIGWNRTLVLNITVNNTGNAAINFNTRGNSTSLNLTGTPSKFMDFEVQAPTGALGAGSSAVMNITITIDTSETTNSQGIYEGYVFLNATDAHPYQGFNLTLQVNLTRELNVFVRSAVTQDNDNEIENISDSQNFTVSAEVFYKNSTELTHLQNASGNFTVALVEGNTSVRIPGGTFTLYNSTSNNPLFRTDTGRYELNASWIANSSVPGGYYNVSLGAQEFAGGQTNFGNISNSTIMVNNSGLWLQAVTSTSISVSDASVTSFNFTVKNLGLIKPNGFINATGVSSSTASITANDSASSCRDAATGNAFTFSRGDDAKTISTAGTETCWFRFKIDPDNVTATKTATMTVSVGGSDGTFNTLSVSLTVTDSNKAADDDDDGGGGAGGGADEDTAAEDEEAAADIFNITDYPSNVEIVQGSNKSVTVTVQNIGDEDQDDVALAVTGVDSSWVTITPSDVNLAVDDTQDYAVDYIVPATAEIKVYDITYKVSNANGEESASANLTVQPSNETKQKIEETYQTLLENVTSLENQLKDLAAKNYNVSEANATLAALKGKLREAGEAIASGDYITANSLLAEANALRAELQQKLAAVAPAAGGGLSILLVAGGIVVLAAVGLVVYMFLPAPQAAYTVGAFKYAPPGGGSAMERAKQRLKDLVQKIKQALSRLKPGSKPSTPAYNFPRSGPTWT